MRLGMEGHQVTAKGTFGETLSCRAVSAKSSPEAHERFLGLFEQHARDESAGWEMNLQWSYRYDAWRESVGWLRVAYLYLFALLGHNYILREELNLVREQFASPRQKLVPQLVKRMLVPAPETQIVCVSSPELLRGFAVRIDNFMVFMPGFADGATLLDRLATLPEKGEFQVVGRQLEVPKKPMLVCDYQPDAVLHLASIEAGA